MGQWWRLGLAGFLIAATLFACGSRQQDDTGPIGADLTKRLQDVLLARGSALRSGDREAFVRTIDTSRPTFRRSQLREFEFPAIRGALSSTFKIQSLERYRGYVRAWVEERIDGNSFPDAFPGERAVVRRYFRSVEGVWVLTEPTGDEVGAQLTRTGRKAELSYWAIDEDVATPLLAALEEAQAFSAKFAPRPIDVTYRATFVPTAELAGPGWDAFMGSRGPNPVTVFPQWYGFDPSLGAVPESLRVALHYYGLQQIRYAAVPGLSGNRLSGDRWLETGWADYNTGVDISPTVKQACAGVPLLTLKQLGNGAPAPGEPGVSPDTYGRYYGFSAAFAGYLLDRFGVDMFWRLMAEYSVNASGAQNFPKVLGVSQEEFYNAWPAWLKQKYC
jgi:hypothetical protein